MKELNVMTKIYEEKGAELSMHLSNMNWNRCLHSSHHCCYPNYGPSKAMNMNSQPAQKNHINEVRTKMLQTVSV